jgi:hypothetical protein
MIIIHVMGHEMMINLCKMCLICYKCDLLIMENEGMAYAAIMLLDEMLY